MWTALRPAHMSTTPTTTAMPTHERWNHQAFREHQDSHSAWTRFWGHLTSVSSTHVSRAAAELDQVVEGWRTRALAECRYLVLDARYERVRIDGQVRDAAVLIAVGVEPSGKRRVLGVSVSL